MYIPSTIMKYTYIPVIKNIAQDMFITQYPYIREVSESLHIPNLTLYLQVFTQDLKNVLVSLC